MRASTLRRRITALPGTKRLCAFEPENDDDGDYDGDDEDEYNDEDDTANYHGDDYDDVSFAFVFVIF